MTAKECNKLKTRTANLFMFREPLASIAGWDLQDGYFVNHIESKYIETNSNGFASQSIQSK